MKFGHIKNPLTVTGIFAGITEAFGTSILPFISIANQTILVWFLIIFPILLVLLFFLTLNFNHKVLYAPSDFRKDQAFLDMLDTMKGIGYKETEPAEQERTDSSTNEIDVNAEKVLRALGGKYTWRTIHGISKEQALPKEIVQQLLVSLSSTHLVYKSAEKERWALTSNGRSVLDRLV